MDVDKSWVNYSIGWIFGVWGIKKRFFGPGTNLLFFYGREQKVQTEIYILPAVSRQTAHKSDEKIASPSEPARFTSFLVFVLILSVTSGEYFGQNPHQHVGLALKFMFPASKYKTTGSRIKKSSFLHPRPRISRVYYN